MNDATGTDALLDRIEELEAKLAEVEAERDAFASDVPYAAQNLIRNALKGRQKALARAEAAEARMAHLEDHIEGVAKDTHKIMVAYEAALPAVYRLALEDASAPIYKWSVAAAEEIEALPTPTAAELMARI